MSWQGPEFVIAIILISTLGWLISTWIRARHGYPVENEWSGTSHKNSLDQTRAMELIGSENEKLRGHILGLEERIAVLERIVTDPAERTARAIEAIRNA